MYFLSSEEDYIMQSASICRKKIQGDSYHLSLYQSSIFGVLPSLKMYDTRIMI